MCFPKCIAAFPVLAKMWKQPECPSTDESIKKVCPYIQGRILSQKKKKKNKIVSFATTWMDLEGIMLSEISQTEKHK